MMGSKNSHDTEVLNCQQQCDNDVIKSSWKEEPGEQYEVLCACERVCMCKKRVRWTFKNI